MKIASLLALLCSLVGVLTFSTRASNTLSSLPQRSIGRLPIERNEPISIRAVRINGKKMRRNEKFIDKDDWLRSLTVEVKNKSQKGVLFASIQLQFPRPRTSDEPFAIEAIEYGDSRILTHPADDSDRIVKIAPGQTVEFRLSDETFNALASGLPQIGYYRGSQRVELRIDRVIFEDETMWQAGEIFRRDPSNSGLWFNTTLAKLTRPSTSPWLATVATERAFQLPTRRFDRDLSGMAPLKGNAYFSNASFLEPPCTQSLQASVRITCDIPNTTCSYPHDIMSLPTGGNYFAASAMGLCKTGDTNTSCGVWKNTQIANTCSSGGGGGGGGGGEGGGNCWSNWDCDIGNQCCEGTCEDEDDLPFDCDAGPNSD